MHKVHISLLFMVGFVISTIADTLDQDSVALVISAAIAQTQVTHMYDPSYVQLAYPNGDVPIDRGVCTDVLIRAFRKLSIDFQVLVHNDMTHHFAAYPAIWGLKKPDRNIDHRRVPNLMKYLARHGKATAITRNPTDYLPGDIVTWKIPGNLDHIGMVTDKRIKGSDRYAIVHNIGRGAEIEDILFEYEITGHYRYFGKHD